MSALETNPLWRYALALYGRPGVREACLLLQDQAGADVCALLACLWLAQRGTPPRVAEPAWAEALARTRVLREEVIAPLRASRRQLKSCLTTLAPAMRDEAAPLPAELLAVELSLERLLVELLFEALGGLAEGREPSDAMEHMRSYTRAAGLTLDAAAFAALTRLMRIAG